MKELVKDSIEVSYVWSRTGSREDMVVQLYTLAFICLSLLLTCFAANHVF
jgi:hypothetical protein